MDIIVHLSSIVYDYDLDDKESLAEAIRMTVLDGDSDAEKCSVAAESVVLGRDDPDRVKAIAFRWNDDIRKAFAQAVNALTPGGLLLTSHLPEGLDDMALTLPLDNQKTFAVSLAARALDNHWHAFGTYGAYLPNDMGYPYWRVTLDDGTLQAVTDHPEDYAMATVSVS